MGMLFARRRQKNKNLTTTENLLRKEEPKVESVKPQVAKSVPTNTTKQSVAQPKFRQ